jgi:hypothetical protein
VVIRVAALLGGCLLLAALFVHFGPARILTLLTSLGWNFLVVVALFLAHELVRTLAIRRWLPADSRPPLREMLLIRLFGEAAGALTRTGSLAAEPARAWLLARRGGGALPGYSAAVGELMTNGAMSAALNVVVAATALRFVSLQGPIVVLAHMVLWGSLVYLMVVAGIVSTRRSLLEACARAVGMLPLVGSRLRPHPGKMGDLQQSISSALTEGPVALARIVLLELAAQTILVCEVYWTVRSMGVPISGRSALFMEVMTRPLTIVELVGATEMGFAAVFTWLGMPAAFGFSLSLVKTLRSLTAAGVGILAGLNIPAMLSSQKDTPSLHIVHAGDARVP